MAYRATEQEVKQVIETALTEEQVTPFLAAANALVTELLAAEGYSDDLMREIERWLAAHFVAIRDPRVASETIGKGLATYHGQSEYGLKHTPYGQQVLSMDFHGKLAAATSAKGPAEVKVAMD